MGFFGINSYFAINILILNYKFLFHASCHCLGYFKGLSCLCFFAACYCCLCTPKVRRGRGKHDLAVLPGSPARLDVFTSKREAAQLQGVRNTPGEAEGYSCPTHEVNSGYKVFLYHHSKKTVFSKLSRKVNCIKFLCKSAHFKKGR